MDLKNGLKRLLWDLSYLSGLLAFFEWIKVHQAECRGILFYYHGINPRSGWDPIQVNTSSSLFRRQIRLIQKKTHVITLEEFFGTIQENDTVSLGRIKVVLTFDDGYQSVLDHAWPFLRDRNIFPALFICTDPLIRRTPLPWDVLTLAVQTLSPEEILPKDFLLPVPPFSLKTWKGKKRFVQETNQYLLGKGKEVQQKLYSKMFGHSWKALETQLDQLYIRPEGLRECLKEGIQIGSHTASHPYLPNVRPEEWEREIRGSKLELESLLGKKISFFSYPAGRVSDSVKECVKGSGYQGALATSNKVVSMKNRDPFSLPRIGPGAMIAMGEFYAKVFGLHPHWYT